MSNELLETEQPKLEELARAYQAQTLAVSIAEASLREQDALLEPLEKALSLAKEGQAAARKALLAAAIQLPSG